MPIFLVALDQELFPIFVVDRQYLQREVFALFFSISCVLEIYAFEFRDPLFRAVAIRFFVVSISIFA
jgi:hypothetical protein